jgi:hypothetical protein
LSRYIVSVEELEILLLLRAERERDWSAAEINQRLRSQEVSIERWLTIIISLGFATRSGDRVRFAPASDELDRELAQVAAAYRERPVKVVEAIFSRKDASLLDFVRAFDLRNRP